MICIVVIVVNWFVLNFFNCLWYFGTIFMDKYCSYHLKVTGWGQFTAKSSLPALQHTACHTVAKAFFTTCTLDVAISKTDSPSLVCKQLLIFQLMFLEWSAHPFACKFFSFFCCNFLCVGHTFLLSIHTLNPCNKFQLACRGMHVYICLYSYTLCLSLHHQILVRSPV